jgi:glycosyltransferase involved in cell wall biosynthesis
MAALTEQLASFRASTSALEGDGRDRQPTDEEIEQHPVTAPGSDALLPAGILYQAGWEPLADGMARHARAQVRALARTGLPVSLRTLRVTTRIMMEEELDPRVIADVGYLRNVSLGSAPVAIRQLVLHGTSYLENTVAPAGARLAGFENELRVYRSSIVYTSWERSTVSPALVEVLNRCAETWVPCRQNRDAFVGAGVKNVYVIPCPYDPDTSLVCKIPAPRGSERVPDGKRFYAIGKWEPRKNYHALVGAFLQEFSPTERASLIIKTHEWGAWDDYPRASECLALWLADPDVQAKGWTAETCAQRVRLVTKMLSEEKLVSLHRDNNIYVTCSHGEAWDMPAFDARLAGNGLVLTGFGGAEDYAGPADVRLWGARAVPLEPAHPSYGWEPEALWASAPMLVIRAALRRARPPAMRVQPPELYAQYGLGPVGAMMAKRIEERFPESYTRLCAVGGFG